MAEQEKMKNYAESAINEGENRLRNVLSEAERKIKQGHEQVTKLASNIDKQARENPWPVVAGVGLSCLLLGIILGKSRN